MLKSSAVLLEIHILPRITLARLSETNKESHNISFDLERRTHFL